MFDRLYSGEDHNYCIRFNYILEEVITIKKICILSISNIKHMTLISLYTEKLIEDNIPYDIIYNDRYGEEENFDADNIYRFENKMDKNTGRFMKFLKYLRFIKYAIFIINANKYDFVIVWNELTAFMFSGYLAKRLNGRYCLNIRDYLYQNYPIIKQIFKKVITNSAFTTISSDGFKNFLPEYDYIHVHSLNSKLLSKLIPRNSLQEKSEKIRISFIGNVRFLGINKEILKVFKNDTRFLICYYGTNAEVLEEYCKENLIENSSFHSSFKVEDTNNFIQKTDMINNIYGNHNISLDYALSIRLYYGIYYQVPLLVSSKTYMAEVVNKYNIGYVIDVIDADLPNEIYDWYHSINFDELSSNCKRALKDIGLSNLKFEDAYQKNIQILNKDS